MTRTRLDRPAVLKAAAELADREGFQAVTLARLAEALDRHVSSLYNHVDGLDGLRHDLAVLGAQGLADAVWASAVGVSGIDAVRSIANAYRLYVLDHQGCYFAMTISRPAGEDDDLAVAGARAMEAICTVLGSFGLPDDEIAHVHRALTSAIRGFMLVELHRGFASSPDAEETFERLVSLFCRALEERTWPNAAEPVPE